MTFEENEADREPPGEFGRLSYWQGRVFGLGSIWSLIRPNGPSPKSILKMDSLTYYQLLRRNRSFRRLWIGQVISELGNWFNFIAALGLVRVVSNARSGSNHARSPLSPGAFHALCSTCRRVRRSMVASHGDDRHRPAARRSCTGPILLCGSRRIFGSLISVLACCHLFGTFFEAAKNAAVPNITGERDLLAG